MTVPVYWHVVTDGAAGAVTDAQILSQISAINRGFSGGEGGAATGFTFSLSGVTRTNNAVWYRSQSAGAEHDMKRALKQGGDNALNVYSTSGGALLGYAYLPEITDTAQAYLDGIVIDWRTIARRLDRDSGSGDRRFESFLARQTLPRQPATRRVGTGPDGPADGGVMQPGVYSGTRP